MEGLTKPEQGTGRWCRRYADRTGAFIKLVLVSYRGKKLSLADIRVMRTMQTVTTRSLEETVNRNTSLLIVILSR